MNPTTSHCSSTASVSILSAPTLCALLSRHEMIAFEIMFGCVIGVISLLIMIALYGSITLFKVGPSLSSADAVALINVCTCFT